MTDFIAVNWGSTNFRAYLVSASGAIVDAREWPAGILKLDRQGMIDTLESATKSWGSGLPIYANGMIGSNVGWENVPYVQTPCTLEDFCRSMHATQIGSKDVWLIPGMSSRNTRGEPDILRGEEIEIFGAFRSNPDLAQGEHTLALPGTHTKWVKMNDGRVTAFFTSMVGEIFDQLSASGLLSSVIEGFGEADQAFLNGIDQGRLAGSGLGRLLFGVRARVVCGDLDTKAAASYARGLMIGTEIQDALKQYPTIADQKSLMLIGNSMLLRLYKHGLQQFEIGAQTEDATSITIAGYRQLHERVLTMDMT